MILRKKLAKTKRHETIFDFIDHFLLLMSVVFISLAFFMSFDAGYDVGYYHCMYNSTFGDIEIEEILNGTYDNETIIKPGGWLEKYEQKNPKV